MDKTLERICKKCGGVFKPRNYRSRMCVKCYSLCRINHNDYYNISLVNSDEYAKYLK